MSPADAGRGAGRPVRYGARDGSAAGGCPVCGQPRPSPRARYCSAACKQRAYRWRQCAPREAGPAPAPARGRRGRGAQTIYECPVCATRYLGVQRCPDCQRFCRMLGLGGACPHCEEPVLYAELLAPA
jgi:hypothetical protein